MSRSKVLYHPASRRSGARRPPHPRVRKVAENAWQLARIEQFRSNVRFAAAAKSYRTALGVTQGEVAREYGVQTATVSRWESGCYFGWTDADLKAYCRIVNGIAGQPASARAATG